MRTEFCTSFDDVLKQKMNILMKEGMLAIREKNVAKVKDLDAWVENVKKIRKNLTSLNNFNIKLSPEQESEIVTLLNDKIGEMNTVYGTLSISDSFKESIMAVDKISLAKLSEIEHDQRNTLYQLNKDEQGINDVICAKDNYIKIDSQTQNMGCEIKSFEYCNSGR